MKLSEFLVQVFGSERSKGEFEQLSDWKEEGALNAKHLKEMSSLNFLANDLKDYQSFDVEAALNKTLSKIEEPAPKKNNRYFIVAFALLLLAAAVIFSYNYFKNTPITHVADAEKIEVRLEDGTMFNLNEHSTLVFDEETNHMSLKGEAFFDVAKQETPLVINTSMGDITVLGTSFNVHSADGFTEIYMFSGIIQYETTENEIHRLEQNEGLRIDSEGLTTFESDNKQLFSYWLDEELIYKNTPLTNVLHDLERLFNKDYSKLKSQSNDLFVTANFKNNSLEEILEELQVITGITF